MLVQLHLDLWSICSLFFSLVRGMDLIFSKWLPSCPKTIFYKWPPFSSNLRYLLYHTLDVYMQLGLFLDFPGYFFDLFVYSCANAAPFNYRGLVVCLIIWLDWFSSELFLVSLFLTILVSLFFPVNFKIDQQRQVYGGSLGAHHKLAFPVPPPTQGPAALENERDERKLPLCHCWEMSSFCPQGPQWWLILRGTEVLPDTPCWGEAKHMF